MPGGRGFLEKLARNVEARRQRLARLLQGARKSLGLTQAEVAEVLARNQSDISKMETGDLIPNVIDLEHFAAMCGKTLNDFDTWYVQCEEDRAKRSLAIPAAKFQRRVEAVRRSRNTRHDYKRRKKMPDPQTESALRPESHSADRPSLAAAQEDFQRKMAAKQQMRRKRMQALRRRTPKNSE